jgi:hypothetical protein
LSAALGLCALGLGGCAMSEDTVANLLVAPGAYEFYTCPQLVSNAASLRARQAELEQLMAKAETDAGGKVMSSMSYRPEYLRARGELRSVEATAREKQCDLTPPPKPAAPATTKKPAR